MEPVTLKALRELLPGTQQMLVFDAQIERVEQRSTREGKPFRLIHFADATGSATLKMWSDHPAWESPLLGETPAFVRVEGDFHLHPTFGPDARGWEMRRLSAEEKENLLAGPEEVRGAIREDFERIVAFVDGLREPRLQAVARLFLEDFGGRFRRTAAARQVHHARRGGLVVHTAAMMRSADALCGVYPELQCDLLLVGALLHDSGKMWETCPEEAGFSTPVEVPGELLGHITIGVELVNALWKKAHAQPAAAEWSELRPRGEEIRLHLLHLIASHHGEMQFGSPVVPKTAEAFALHYLDNLDAKLEMVRHAFATGVPLAPQIVERVWPLPGNLVRPPR